MNDRQNFVVATVVCGLILIVVYLCPWRIESTNELRWSPIYQSPMSYVRTYDNARGSRGSSRIVSHEAHIAYELLALEVAALLAAGAGMFWFYSDRNNRQENSEAAD